MANITLLGASFSNVPAVDLPSTGGGTARFYEVDGTQTVTANGVYDVTTDASVVVNVSGGSGASNFVEGTFTTPSTAGGETVSIPYQGSGYPIMCVVVVDGGAYVSGTTWYTSVQRYAVGQWTMTKSYFDLEPSYSTGGTNNYGVVTSIYKNSTSSSTSYTRTSTMTGNVFSSSSANASSTTCIRFRSKTIMTYYTNTSSYGLLPDTTYHYYIVYSS